MSFRIIDCLGLKLQPQVQAKGASGQDRLMVSSSIGYGGFPRSGLSSYALTELLELCSV